MTNIDAARVLGEILASGMSKAAVARELGRDSGLMTQIERGRKGASYVPALSALRDRLAGRNELPPTERLAVQQMVPERRAASGRKAAVRQKSRVTAAGGRSAMGRAGRQAVKSGAAAPGKVVEQAAADKGGRGRVWIEFDVTGVAWPEDDRKSPVIRKRPKRHRFGGNLGMPAKMWAQRMQAAGGNVAVAIERWLNDGLPGGGGLTPAEWRTNGEGPALYPELAGNAASAEVTYVEIRASTV